MPYIVALVLAFIGAILGQGEGFLAGSLLGIVFILWRQHDELGAVEKRVDGLAKQLAALTPPPAGALASAAPMAAEPPPETPAAPVEPVASSVVPPTPTQPATEPPTPQKTPSDAWQQPASAAYEPSAFELAIDRGIAQVKRFFTTGNVVVRIGVVVLFFGIAFLL